MAPVYQLAFEQIQLLSGLGPDQAVYLLMQAKAFDADSPDAPYFTATVGGLSPDDANAPEAGIISGSGRFASSLPEGAIVRNDGMQYGLSIPNFFVGPVAVDTGQMLELSIVMAPAVWFESVKVPIDDLDKFLISSFITLVGQGGFGAVGAAVAGVASFLGLGSAPQDVTVPCYNVVIAARHLFSGADLAGWLGQGMLRFGPAGPAASYGCPRIDSFYWLSVNQPLQLFGPVSPTQAGDCTLDGVDDSALEAKFAGTWGDRGDMTLDCVRAIVSSSGPGQWDVELWDAGQTADPALVFRNVPASLDLSQSLFRNVYGNGACPARSITPVCQSCTGFTNVEHGLWMPAGLVAGAGFRASHVGSRPLLPLTVDTDHELGSRPVVTRQPSSATTPESNWLPDRRPIRLSRSTIAYQPVPDMVVLSGELDRTVGSLAGPGDPTQVAPHALTLHLAQDRTLSLYCENSAAGASTCFRLRYRLSDANGLPITDVMLMPDAEVIN